VYNSKRQTTELVLLLPIRKILRLPFVSPLLLTHPQLLLNYGRTAHAALWRFVRAAKITRSSPTQKFFLAAVPSSLSPRLHQKDESAVSPVVVRDLHAWLTVTFQITDCRIIWLIKNAPRAYTAFECSQSLTHRKRDRSLRASLALFACSIFVVYASSICHSGARA